MEWVSKEREIFLNQKENMTWNIFAILELDLEFLVQEEQREEGISTYNFFVRREEEEELENNFVQRVRGRKGVK